MLNETVITSALNDIRFQLDLKDSAMPALIDIKDTEVLSLWLSNLRQGLSLPTAITQKNDAQIALDKLAAIIKEEDEKSAGDITNEEIKEIYFGIKSGQYDFICAESQTVNGSSRPQFIGSEFIEKASLEHYEVNPIGKKYSEQYGGTAVRHIIESLISKYKPADMDELRSLFRYVDKPIK